MFKKILLISAALVFASGVLVTSVMRTSAKSLAQNYKVESISIAATDETATEGTEGSPVVEEKVEYVFPYPGILPDHFLYPLKMIRDRIWLFLTTDSLKKAELLLKFGDKRLWAAQMLVDKGKEELAVGTATKAEKYLERAINQAAQAKEVGKETGAFLEKLSSASLKHEEVLLEIKGRVSEQAKGAIEEALEYPRRVVVRAGAEIKATLKLEFSEGQIDAFGEIGLEKPATAFGILEKAAGDNDIELVTKQYDFGIFVESIGGVKNTKERTWIYFVNGKAGEVASDKRELVDGDEVEWRYIEPIY